MRWLDGITDSMDMSLFIERTDAEAEAPNTLATWREELTHWKRPGYWERLKTGEEGDNRRWDGWMASLTQWTWVWATPGVGDGQGGLASCSPWGRKELDTTEWLNNQSHIQSTKTMSTCCIQPSTVLELVTSSSADRAPDLRKPTTHRRMGGRCGPWNQLKPPSGTSSTLSPT